MTPEERRVRSIEEQLTGIHIDYTCPCDTCRNVLAAEIRAAVEEEREACAKWVESLDRDITKVAESLGIPDHVTKVAESLGIPDHIITLQMKATTIALTYAAKAIRARGDEPLTPPDKAIG